MIILDDYRLKLVDIRKQIEELANAMRIKQVKEKLAEFETVTADPEFWNDMERSQKILVEQKRQKSVLDAYTAVVTAPIPPNISLSATPMAESITRKDWDSGTFNSMVM